MNNKNKILVGCLALLLVLSVGYAYFSDTITINGTATAKGEFDLTTEIVNLEQEDWFFNSFAGINPTKGIVEDPVITINDNEISTSVTLGMPGSHKIFGIKVTNTGSIPAKLKSIENVTTGGMIIGELDWGDSSNCIGEANVNIACASFFMDSGWVDDYEGDITTGARWMESAFDPMFLDAVLDPGEEAYYFTWYEWGYNSTKQGDPINVEFSVKINWEQAT